jgi:hypothetical protein
MKKAANKNGDPDMLKECDSSKGVRGKYAQRYAAGSNVVALPPDLAEAFPKSKAVTDALRGLVSLARQTATVTDRKAADQTLNRQLALKPRFAAGA